MQKRKFKPADLKPSKFLFHYWPGNWSGIGAEQYRHPTIVIYKMLYDQDGAYDSPVMDITFQMDKGRPYAYAMRFNIQADRYGKDSIRIAAKIINLETPQNRWRSRRHQIHQLLAGLQALNIPRAIRWNENPQHSDILIPRRFKGRERDYHTARQIVEATPTAHGV